MNGEKRLREIVREFSRVAVAYSGGVDSAVLLAVCAEELGDRVLAITAVSGSLPKAEREGARDLARALGVEHVEVETAEMENDDYARNEPDRCYHCKHAAFAAMAAVGGEEPRALLYGANADDVGDYRPGSRAAEECGVRAPLQEAGIGKNDVRALAHRLGLPVWDKPSAPCLASRIPYGTPVTPDALEKIEAAEVFLREEMDFAVLRVRHHGDLARIELPADDLSRALDERARIVARMRAIGYTYTSLDLEGFRSGSLNEVLSREDRGS
jgi:pyridinium-3,5-biscarboxylic acid mononucleotide sulfurtransferase